MLTLHTANIVEMLKLQTADTVDPGIVSTCLELFECPHCGRQILHTKVCLKIAVLGFYMTLLPTALRDWTACPIPTVAVLEELAIARGHKFELELELELELGIHALQGKCTEVQGQDKGIIPHSPPMAPGKRAPSQNHRTECHSHLIL